MADYEIDAKGKRLGRLASEIAVILSGKKNPDYAPNKVTADRALVKNADKITVTGNKLKNRIYYRHTGYMGHLKEASLGEAMQKDPQKVLREAVKHMLPKNFLNSRRIKNLIFVDNGGE